MSDTFGIGYDSQQQVDKVYELTLKLNVARIHESVRIWISDVTHCAVKELKQTLTFGML